MSGINKAIIVGNLGSDVEIRYTQDGRAVANINVATSESWTDKNTAQKQEKTEWHRVVIFGKLAEIANQYLRKGSKVYVEGKLQTRKWQDQQGNDRYSTEIVVSGFGGTLQMLDKRSDGSYTPEQTETEKPPETQQSENTTKASEKKDNPDIQKPLEQPDDFDDDIPF